MNWRGVMGGVAGLALVALLAFGLSRDPNAVPNPLTGTVAPAFTLESLDGDTLDLADYAGGVVLLNFWASWCLACIDEHPLLVQVDRVYEGQDVHVLGVVYQDTRSNAQRWMQQRGGDWPNLLDYGSRVAIAYGVRGVPETFFIGRDGRVAFRQIGPITPELVATLIPRLLADSAVTLSPEERVGTSPGYVRSSPQFPETEGTTGRR